MTMEVKDVSPDPYLTTMPTTNDESELVQMLFERATKLYPDWKMGDRTDLAMSMLGVVKQWAHKNKMTTYKKEEEIPYPRRVRDAGE